MKIFAVLLLYLLNYHNEVFSASISVTEDELASVLVFFRHGDRAPKKSFPKDEYFNLTYWPMGFGQLTQYGINRQFELGKWFRNRYSSFLPEEYSPKDIYVFSTEVDRTLMSAAANLAGLYPPKKYQIWNPNLLWQPIPVHTIPRLLDSIITYKRECKKYDKLLKKAKKSDYFKKINEDGANLFRLISNHTGLNVTDIKDVKLIRSNFYAYENYNKSFVPAWASLLNQTEVDYLAGVAYERDSYTKKMKRLQAGPFFYNLITHFDKIINVTEDTPKFFMISAHDTALVPVLNSMGVYDFHPPDFAATVIWELRKTSNGSYYVKTFYKETSGLNQLNVLDCDIDCGYKKFKENLAPFTADISTWEKECDDDDDDDEDD